MGLNRDFKDVSTLAGIPVTRVPIVKIRLYIHVDDILIHAKSLEEHDKRLDQVLSRIRESGLKLNKKKCKFRQSTIKYLGQIFSAEGMKPDPSKVEAIKQLAPPQNVTEVQRFCRKNIYPGK